MLKVCTRCGVNKPLSSYYLYRGEHYRKECKSCYTDKNRIYLKKKAAKNKENNKINEAEYMAFSLIQKFIKRGQNE